MERESFKSRLGFLLVSAGCASGHRQCVAVPVCRRARTAAALFVLLYLIMLVVLGLPVLTMELAVGTGQPQKRCPGLSSALEKPKAQQVAYSRAGSALLGCCLLMMYYTTCLRLDAGLLSIKFATGALQPALPRGGQRDGVFSAMLARPRPDGPSAWRCIGRWPACWSAPSASSKGLERISKWHDAGALFGADPGPGSSQPHPRRRQGGRAASIWSAGPSRRAAAVGLGPGHRRRHEPVRSSPSAWASPPWRSSAAT